MKIPCRQLFLIVILLVIPILGFSQPNSNYFKNFVLADGKIYTLCADGVIKVFDQGNGNLLKTYDSVPKIQLLTLDRYNNIIVADDKNKIRKFDPVKNIWEPFLSYNGDKLYDIVFSNKNICFLITDKGILNANNHKIYYPDVDGWQSDDGDIKTYIDKHDNIWVEFGHGEWGNSLFILNTLSGIFSGYDNVTAMPFFEFNNHVFALASSFMSASIIQYDKKINKDGTELYPGKIVYDEEKDPSFPKKYHYDNKFYLGGFTYNSLDGRLYVVSSLGLLTASASKTLSKFSDWTLAKNLRLPKITVTTTTDYIYNKKNADTIIIHHKRIMDNIYNKKRVHKLSEPGLEQFAKIQFTPKGNLVLLSPFNGFCLLTKTKLIKL